MNPLDDIIDLILIDVFQENERKNFQPAIGCTTPTFLAIFVIH